MKNTNINVEKYEKIHCETGYKLATVAEVFVPWFHCTLKCKCEKEYSMSEIDKFVCMCVDRGVNTAKDISFVLSLDKEITSGEIERLVLGGILSLQGEILAFTKFGKECFLKKSRIDKEIKEFSVFMNAVTGEWMIEEENFISEKMLTETGIRISPIKAVGKQEIENNNNILKKLEIAYETNILQIKLLDYKVIVYQKETILFYENDIGKILFEIFDEEKEELDLNVSSALRKRYEKREILELMQAEKHIESAKTTLLELLKEEHPATNLKPLKSNLRYMRNQEIRELFLKKLDEVEQHIFIISPWITDFVVDEGMVEKFETILKRGVKVDIGYGYASLEKMKWKIQKYEKKVYTEKEKSKIEEQKEYDREYQSWNMSLMLKEKLKDYENFHIFYVLEGTHEKIFCYDDTHIFIGSLNLLSYDGGEQENYSGFQFRYEGGVLIEDKMFALEVMNDFKVSIVSI